MSISSLQSGSLYGAATDGSSDSTATSFRSLTGLNLTSEQRQNIRSIFQNAQSTNLSPSDVASQITAVLTPDQTTQFQSAQNASAAQNSSSSQTSQAGGAPPAGHGGHGGHSGHKGSDPFADLDLSSSQQSQISAIFNSASTSSPQQIQTAIDNVLTPAQLSTLQSEQPPSPPPSSGTASSNAPQQILAANSILQGQTQNELNIYGFSGGSTPDSGSTSSTSLSDEFAASLTGSLDSGDTVDPNNPFQFATGGFNGIG